MTRSRVQPKTNSSHASPYYFVQLTQGDGKVHANTRTAEAMRYHLADRKRRNRIVNAALLRDPSVQRISSGWQEFQEVNSAATSPSDSDPEATSEDDNRRKLMTCSGQQLEHLLALYVQTVVPIAQSFSRRWRWSDDIDHIKDVPMLAYAAAAYTSAFFMVFERHAQDISGFWLDLETKSLSWLRRALCTGASREDWIPTTTLLMRLAWLLGDLETARMHAYALRQMLAAQNFAPMDLEVERLFVGRNGQEEVRKRLQAYTTKCR
ncbi:hypothetical protein H2200_008060 [Cladophialophora chaetospira]|uniref:Uncharacterized protein n=1 Tax=Cladophialophora chaetospira TaxID=386627 RepID=A0AA38X7D1_9EURO|nr:hypothetical protein H2200_008060 [Cladophialophora chaetospira]